MITIIDNSDFAFNFIFWEIGDIWKIVKVGRHNRSEETFSCDIKLLLLLLYDSMTLYYTKTTRRIVNRVSNFPLQHFLKLKTL